MNTPEFGGFGGVPEEAEMLAEKFMECDLEKISTSGQLLRGPITAIDFESHDGKIFLRFMVDWIATKSIESDDWRFYELQGETVQSAAYIGDGGQAHEQKYIEITGFYLGNTKIEENIDGSFSFIDPNYDKIKILSQDDKLDRERVKS